MSVEEVKEHFVEVGPGKRFGYDPSILDRALDAQAKRQAQPSTVPYTLERERTMLKAFGRHVLDILHRRATDVRSSHPLVSAEGAVDWVGEAIEGDRVQAQVCRLLGLMGTSAQIRPDERERLRAKGFSDIEIDQIDATARRHARVEDERDWLIGPERDVLVYHLDAVGIAPLDVNVRRLRASALCLMADLLERTSDRYIVVSATVGEIAAEILRDPDLPSGASEEAPSEASLRLQAGSRSEVDHPSETIEDQQVPTPTVDARPPASFLQLVEELARFKTNPKARSWDHKTARQHISAAKLLVKIAHTDDPRQITQAHVGAYISLLAQLPTHWGKSADDADRSIGEIMARAEDLDDDEIGLAAPTINRHRTQLSTILAHMAENGNPIGSVSKKSLAKDTRSPDEKRNAFTAEEGRILIADASWTLCSSASTPSYPSLETTDSQFWVFLLAWNMLTRLAKIYLDMRHCFPSCTVLQPLRRCCSTKSGLRGSTRPCLMPANSGKTMHSTRKGGNGAMISGKVMDATRYYIMGHAPKDVHGKLLHAQA